MKKKVTNEDVGQVFGDIAEQVRDKMDYAFRVAQSQMWIAENDLIDSLDEKQRELYNDFREKREAFFRLAQEMYERKI